MKCDNHPTVAYVSFDENERVVAKRDDIEFSLIGYLESGYLITEDYQCIPIRSNLEQDNKTNIEAFEEMGILNELNALMDAAIIIIDKCRK